MVNGVKLIEVDKLNEKAARNSCFYYFAKILQAAYPGGQVCLAFPKKHFVYKYAGQVWDIEGRYTDGVKLINETKIPNNVLRVFKHLNSSPNTYDKDIDAWIEQAKTE